MRALSSALLLLLVLLPCYCYAWTGREWLGVIEAVAGAVVIRPHTAPSGDVCENCSGTGRLGDGTVSVVCPVCEGTGKPVQPGSLYSSKQGCASCDSPATIDASPTQPGMEAPAAKQEAVGVGGGTYKKRIFRRR